MNWLCEIHWSECWRDKWYRTNSIASKYQHMKQHSTLFFSIPTEVNHPQQRYRIHLNGAAAHFIETLMGWSIANLIHYYWISIQKWTCFFPRFLCGLHCLFGFWISTQLMILSNLLILFWWRRLNRNRNNSLLSIAPKAR